MVMKVTVYIDSANEIYGILDTLKARGLVIKVDFTFAYIPTELDDTWEIKHKKCVVFDFTDEKNATWFSLLI